METIYLNDEFERISFEDLAKIFKPRKEIQEEVKKQLEPLFSDFYAGSATYKMYFKYKKQFDAKIGRSNDFFRTLTDTLKTVVADPKATCVNLALSYLTAVELVGSVYVNMIILLLVARGQDLHLEPDRNHWYTRHVTSLEDLESPALSLSTKLDFLEMNGLRFFSKWVGRKLRNKIAHLNFQIDDDGKFFLLTRKGRKEVDLFKKILLFQEYLVAVFSLIQEQTSKVRKPPHSLT